MMVRGPAHLHILRVRESIKRHRVRIRCSKCAETLAMWKQKDVVSAPKTAKTLLKQAVSKHALTCDGEPETLLELAS